MLNPSLPGIKKTVLDYKIQENKGKEASMLYLNCEYSSKQNHRLRNQRCEQHEYMLSSMRENFLISINH